MRLSHWSIPIAISLAASACATEPEQPAGPPPGAPEAILAQERTGLDEWSAGNPAGYAHSAVEDFTYFDDIGAATRIEGREAWVEYLSALPVPPHRYEILNPSVQVYDDVGILTLHYHGYGDGPEPMSRWKATSVYRYVDGEWRQVHAHWSLIKEE